jgi:hypothetical protein
MSNLPGSDIDAPRFTVSSGDILGSLNKYGKLLLYRNASAQPTLCMNGSAAIADIPVHARGASPVKREDCLFN